MPPGRFLFDVCPISPNMESTLFDSGVNFVTFHVIFVYLCIFALFFIYFVYLPIFIFFQFLPVNTY